MSAQARPVASGDERLGRCQTVHAPGHIDVREDNLDVLSSFEERDGFIGIASFNRLEPCVFWRKAALRRTSIIIDDENNNRDITTTEIGGTDASMGSRQPESEVREEQISARPTST